MKKIQENWSKNVLKSILISNLIGIICSFLLITLFAVILSMCDFSENMSAYMSIAIVGVSAYFVGFFAAKIYGKRGFLIGVLSGIVYYIFFTIIAIAISKDSLSLMFLLRTLLVVTFSALGGIIAVNGNDKRKII